MPDAFSFSGRMPVVDPYFVKVDLFILRFPVKAGIEVVDQEVFAFFLLRPVEGHDQGWEKDQVGKHGDDQGSGSKCTQGNGSAKIGKGENDESGEQYDRGIHDALAGLQDTVAYRFGDEKV